MFMSQQIVDRNSPCLERRIVGGKGKYLQQLREASLGLETFEVPRFFVIPVDHPAQYESTYFSLIKPHFNKLQKPVAVRSSSPLEDGIKATFAGLFDSVLDVCEFDEFIEAFHFVVDSACRDSVQNHARRMEVQYTNAMAVIVQEQVEDPSLYGIVQLDSKNKPNPSFRCEFFQEGSEVSYSNGTDALAVFKKNIIHRRRHGNVRLLDYYAIVQAAIDARDYLRFESEVQLEVCFSPDKPIQFVQIREFPEKKSDMSLDVDLNIPEGAPHIVSEICNGIAGDIVLPAYVTFSRSGFELNILEKVQINSDYWEHFRKNSNIPSNPDFTQMLNYCNMEKLQGRKDMMPDYGKMWGGGNSLFDDYVLVCDKLDESIHGMHEMTTNKRAIITTMEAFGYSHAMTVARELGIPAMGAWGDVRDLESFYNHIQTGDIVHMKSDGERGVAYIEKKREIDPFD